MSENGNMTALDMSKHLREIAERFDVYDRLRDLATVVEWYGEIGEDEIKKLQIVLYDVEEAMESLKRFMQEVVR